MSRRSWNDVIVRLTAEVDPIYFYTAPIARLSKSFRDRYVIRDPFTQPMTSAEKDDYASIHLCAQAKAL